MRTIFAAAAIASIQIMNFPAFADERTETAVRLFLGMGNGSAVKAEQVLSENADVVVKNLTLPIIAGPGAAPSQIQVREMRFVGVEADGRDMKFKGIAGTGFLLSGEEKIAARSLVIGPGKAKDLGATAFAIDGDVTMTFMDIVAPSKAGTIRVGSYKLSMSGDPSGEFQQSSRFEGVRPDQLKLGSAAEGIQAEMLVKGNGAARVLDGSISLQQADFGEIRAKFELERIEPATDRLSLMIGYGLLAGAPLVKGASVSYSPSEQIRTLLMFTTGEQRKSLVDAVSPFVKDKLGMEESFAQAATAEVEKFLGMPVRLAINFAPPTPMGLSDLMIGRPDGKTEKASALGLSIKSGN